MDNIDNQNPVPKNQSNRWEKIIHLNLKTFQLLQKLQYMKSHGAHNGGQYVYFHNTLHCFLLVFKPFLRLIIRINKVGRSSQKKCVCVCV